MTKETRYLFQLIDIRGIEFTCLKDGCNARTTLDPSKLRDQRSWICPNCGHSLAETDTPIRVAFEKLFSAIRIIKENQKPAKVEVRLEMEVVESKNDAK
jgi:hypothetical protein